MDLYPDSARCNSCVRGISSCRFKSCAETALIGLGACHLDYGCSRFHRA
jgi:hypothetical protein